MSKQMISKQCSKCKQIKPVSEFSKYLSRKDGFQGYCKECAKNIQKKFRKTMRGIEAIKRYNNSQKGKTAQKRYHQSGKYKIMRNNYNQSKKGRITNRRNALKQYYGNPLRAKAQRKVRTAIRNGKLPKPNTLQCRYGNHPAQEYHHYLGYIQEHWFDVLPICIKCHRKIHNQNSN